MDQTPMRGAAPLDPPSPEVARRYLDEVDRVVERRDDQVDLRPQGWLTIVQGVLVAGLVGCTIVAFRSGDTPVAMLLLMAFLMAGQVLTGATERVGGQRRFTRWRWLYYGALVLAGAGIIATYGLNLLSESRLSLPLGLILAPAGFAVLVLIAIGACQLWVSRGAPSGTRRELPPFVWPARGTTLAFGVLFGIMVVAAASGDMLFTSVLTVLSGIALVIASVGSGTDWGLAYLGQVWRWPQFLMLSAALAAIAATVVAGSTGSVDPLVGVLVGAGIVILAVIVSLAPLSAKADRRV
jgi:MFS family permease